MHRDGKWAREILSLQEPDGKWGSFHSLSSSRKSMTTEQALRRLERLGFTIEDECIQKAILYMTDCLEGRNHIPDPREKLHDWDIFTSLMLSAWIRRFTPDCPAANRTAADWTQVISHAFASGEYSHDRYLSAYREIFSMKPSGGRLVDFVSFYPLSLMKGCLPPETEDALVRYVLNHEPGIYYIYEKKLSLLPAVFESREASRYLAAAELLAEYPGGHRRLFFLSDWLNAHRSESGWDMGPAANDKVYLPLSDSWRSEKIRRADCTERISALLMKIAAR